MSSTAPVLDPEDVARRLVPVVLGGDVLAYSIARCLHEAYGIRTTVISNIDVKITSTSRFVDYRIFPQVTNGSALEDHLEAMGRDLAAKGLVGLLVGSADWQARFLSHAKERLSPWFHIPVSDPALFDTITQKQDFYALCEARGVPYPKTWSLDPVGETPDADGFCYPLILKPSHSPSWDLMDFPGKRKIWELDGPRDFEAAWAAIAASGYDHPMVAQDFVPGGDEEIRSLTCLVDPMGEVRLVSGGQVVLQDHSPSALGNPVCIVGERVGPIIEGAKRLLADSGYVGYANFDIKRDPRDGQFRFFEVNARAGRNTYYVTLGGANFAEALVRAFVLGERLGYLEAYDPFCYGLVPFSVVKGAVGEGPLLDSVRALRREGRYASPLAAPSDSAAHKLWVAAYEARQVGKFREQRRG